MGPVTQKTVCKNGILSGKFGVKAEDFRINQLMRTLPKYHEISWNLSLIVNNITRLQNNKYLE